MVQFLMDDQVYKPTLSDEGITSHIFTSVSGDKTSVLTEL